MSDWPFADPENTAAFTLRDVVEGRTPILLATHDDDDGCWQFLDNRVDPNPDDGLVVPLRQIVLLDPTLRQLADLPAGWCAWRAAPEEPWQREELVPEEEEEGDRKS
jgi:hypothetical protein